MKVRLEAILAACDGERGMTCVVEMPAPPFPGLHVAGRGWDVEVECVRFLPESTEYRAACAAVRDEGATLANLVRTFEIEGWRPLAK